MMDLIEKYALLIAAFLVIAVNFYWLFKWRIPKDQKKKRNFWDYYFIWPLLLSRKEGDHYVKRDFSRREWTGIISIVLLVLLALIFVPGKPK